MSDFKIVSVLNPAPVYANVSGILDVSLSGNTAGALGLISTGTIILAGGNNITLSQNGQSVSIIGGAGAGGGGVAISAGANSTATGTVIFSNANGVTFGMDTNGTVTATVATNYQSQGPYLTTAMLSNAVTLSNINFSGGTTSANRSNWTFADSNGISWGVNTNGSITATVATNYQSQGPYLTTADLSQNSSKYVQNWKLTGNTSGTTSSAQGTDLWIAGGNGVTVSGSSNTISLSVATNYQSQGAYLTTADLSQNSSKYVQNWKLTGNTSGTTSSANGTDLWLAGGNGVTVSGSSNTISISVATNYQSQGAYLTTAMQSNAVTLSNINVSAGGAANNLSAITFSNANGVSFGIAASVITASVAAAGGAQTAISGIIVSDATYTSGTVSFSNQNGVTIGSSVNGASQYIRLSVNTNYQSQGAYLTTAGLSGDTTKYIQNWKLTGNTSGTTSSAQGTDLWLAGGNGVTISGSSNTLSFSVATNYQSQGAYLTTAALSGDSSKYAINWNLTGNTSGTTSSNQGSGWWFSGGNNITISGSSNSIVISAGNAAPSPVNFSAGAASANLGSVVFSNLNGVSFGLNGSTITASVVAGAAGGVALYDGANSITSGTAQFSNSNGVTFGINGQTVTGSVAPVSQLTGVNGITVSSGGSTISIMPQWLSSYENNEGGLANSQAITYPGASKSLAVNFNLYQPISASFLRIPILMTTNSTTVATLASASATAQGALYSTWNAVVYSLQTGANSQSLSQVASGSVGWTFSQAISITNSTQGSYSQGITGGAQGALTSQSTQYSISNTNYSFTTNQIATAWSTARMLDINFAQSIPPGNYWLVLGLSTSSSSAGAVTGITNCNVQFSNIYVMSQANLAFGVMGSTNFTSGGNLGGGSFSTAGGATQGNIPLSAISSSASNPMMYFQLLRSA